MQQDLHMSDTMWSAGISMFYVGYIISQVPANVIIAKGKPRILLPCCMLGWSAVTICMPAVTAGWGFLLCRFIVGVTEGPFVPAVSLMTSSWYTKHESPLRMGIWHAGNTISQAISGLLAAGVLQNMDNIAGLAAWQWFLLLEGTLSLTGLPLQVQLSTYLRRLNVTSGIVSILVALASFWFIPNFPESTGTYFFTAAESQMAQYRQEVSAGGRSEDDEGDYWGGVWMALKDPFTYFFSAIHFFLIIAQSYKDFFPSVSKFYFSVLNLFHTVALGSRLSRSSLRLASIKPPRTSSRLRHPSLLFWLRWRCLGLPDACWSMDTTS